MCARNVALRMQTNYDILLSFAQWMEFLNFVENFWFDSQSQVILYLKLKVSYFRIPFLGSSISSKKQTETSRPEVS